MQTGRILTPKPLFKLKYHMAFEYATSPSPNRTLDLLRHGVYLFGKLLIKFLEKEMAMLQYTCITFIVWQTR